jgi:hypothetical protein
MKHQNIYYYKKNIVGETGVYRDTGSKGTVGGKIVDKNKIKTNFSMLFQYVYSTLARNLVEFVHNCTSYGQNKKIVFF